MDHIHWQVWYWNSCNDTIQLLVSSIHWTSTTCTKDMWVLIAFQGLKDLLQQGQVSGSIPTQYNQWNRLVQRCVQYQYGTSTYQCTTTWKAGHTNTLLWCKPNTQCIGWQVCHRMSTLCKPSCYSKKQSTSETATYGAEFSAVRTCFEQIIDLRQSLRYLGVPYMMTAMFLEITRSWLRALSFLMQG